MDLSKRNILAVVGKSKIIYNDITVNLKEGLDTVVVFYLADKPAISQIFSQDNIIGVKWDYTGQLLCAFNRNGATILRFGEMLMKPETVHTIKIESLISLEWFQQHQILSIGMKERKIGRESVGLGNEFKKMSLSCVSAKGTVSVWTYDDSGNYFEISGELGLNPIINAEISSANKFLRVLGASMHGFHVFEVAISVQKKELKTRSIYSMEFGPSVLNIMKWIGSELFILATSDSMSGKLGLYSISAGQVTLVASKEVGIVQSICHLGGFNKSSLVYIGYSDGNTEYRSLPDLNTISDEGTGLGLLSLLSTAGSDSLMTTDLDDFFENNSNLFVPTRVPMIMTSSPNAFIPITAAKNKYGDSNDLTILLPKLRIEKINEENGLGIVSNLFAHLTITSLINGADFGDLRFVYAHLSEDQRSKLSSDICKKSLILYQEAFGNLSWGKIELGGVANDGVTIISRILSYTEFGSKHYTDLLLMQQISYIREMYERRLVDPVEMLDLMASNPTADLSKHDSFIFIKGSTHHITAFAIWVLDFGAYLVRLIYLHCSSIPEPDSHGSNRLTVEQYGWLFLLHRLFHSAFQEIIILTNWFLSNIQAFKMKFPYVQTLDSIINSSRIRSKALLEYWLSVGQLLSNFHNEKPKAATELEESLVMTGKVLGGYRPLISSLQRTVIQMVPEFYHYRADNELHKSVEKVKLGNSDPQLCASDLFISSIMSQSTRFSIHSRFDSLLFQNISTKDLKTCQGCGMVSQLAIDIDDCITEFQSSPSWMNTYVSKCYCGGQWGTK